MLWNVTRNVVITRIPHLRRWDELVAALPTRGLDRIKKHLNRIADQKDILTTSWIPGRDWTGTPYAIIYRIARGDEILAARYFGLIVWVVIMERPECWAFGRYEIKGRPIEGLTYFRVSPARSRSRRH